MIPIAIKGEGRRPWGWGALPREGGGGGRRTCALPCATSISNLEPCSHFQTDEKHDRLIRLVWRVSTLCQSCPPLTKLGIRTQTPYKSYMDLFVLHIVTSSLTHSLTHWINHSVKFIHRYKTISVGGPYFSFTIFTLIVFFFALKFVIVLLLQTL